MNFLIDAHLPYALCQVLRKRGFDLSSPARYRGGCCGYYSSLGIRHWPPKGAEVAKIQIEKSTDLITWNPATVSSTTTVSDNGSIRTYKAKVPLDGAEKKFLRLKLTGLTN